MYIFSTLIIILFAIASAITLAGISNSFHIFYIFLFSFIFYYLIVKWFKLGKFPFPLSTRSKWIILFLVLVCIAFQFHEDFIGGQDSVSHFLPMSRYLSKHHSFLTHWGDNRDPDAIVFKAGYPPLLHGLGATLFLITGLQNEMVVAIIPIFFFLGFSMLVFKWVEDENRATSLLALLLVSSPFFIERFSWFFQECLITFSATLLFYMLWKYTKDPKDIYIKYAIIGSGLGLLSKHTGIFFTAFLIWFLIYKKIYDKRIWISFFIVHLLPMLWFVRNVKYFGSPFLPSANFLTINPSIKEAMSYATEIFKSYNFFTPVQFILAFVMLTWLPVWIILKLFFRNRSIDKSSHLFYQMVTYLFIVYFIAWFFFSPSYGFRFFMPFYGFILLEITYYLPLLLKRWRIKIFQFSYFSFLTLTILSILILIGDRILFKNKRPILVPPSSWLPQYLSAINSMQKKGIAKNTKVFIDTDHAFRWFAKYIVYDPSEPFFVKDFAIALTSGDVYNLCKKYNIEYVINSPWNSPWEESLFQSVRDDKVHFKEIYNDKNASLTIWKVIYIKEEPKINLIVNGDKKEMVLISGGKNDFYIDRYEVTIGEYKKFLQSETGKRTPRQFISPYGGLPKDYFTNKKYDNYPVVLVSWYDAHDYAVWVGKRLPTKEEWGLAAKGENKMKWPWGNEFIRENANFAGATNGSNKIVPIGSFPNDVSPYGVVDMAGNVCEWVSTDAEPSIGKDLRDVKKITRKIIMGCSWDYPKDPLHIDHYEDRPASALLNYVGFRCVKDR